MPNHQPRPRHHPLYGFKLTSLHGCKMALSCRARQCRWSFIMDFDTDLEAILGEAIIHRLECNHPIQDKTSIKSSVLSDITIRLPKPGNSS